MPTSPERFKKAFQIATQAKTTEIQCAWKGPQGNFTQVMRSTLPTIADDLKLVLYNADYYTLDAIFYTERDTQHFNKNTTYAKFIEIAFEHENQVNGAVAEINKLQLFNVPLKVLVTYVEKSNQAAHLERYSTIINDADVFGDFSYVCMQLVIFGEFIDNQPTWSFWKYLGRGFMEI